jgi:hypothetical protein
VKKLDGALSIKAGRIILGAILIVGIGSWLALRPRSPGSQPNPIVAKVGDYTLRQRDAELRDQVTRLQKKRGPMPVGLEELIASYTKVQILKNVGREIGERAILQEEERIAQLLGPGGSLHAVRALFGEDKEAFRRVYLVPNLAERQLYQSYFKEHAPEQVKARVQAEELLKALQKQPRSAKELAKKHGFKYSKLIVSRSSGLRWDDEPAPSPKAPTRKLAANSRRPASLQGELWYRKVVGKLKAGQVRPTLQEFGEAWLVVRVVGPAPKERDAIQLDVVHVPQASFVPWLQQESAKVEVQRGAQLQASTP